MTTGKDRTDRVGRRQAAHPVVHWAAALLAVVGAACAPPADLPDAATVVAELMEADRVFAADVAERGTDAWVEAFADSGTMFRPGGTIRGHDAIREMMAPAFADTSFRLTWDPVEAFASPDGQLGYTIGRYTSRRRDADGAVVESTGSYLTLWRRQADGVWKAVADIGNPDE
jgi:ketosteroid isomerase-like protein